MKSANEYKVGSRKICGYSRRLHPPFSIRQIIVKKKDIGIDLTQQELAFVQCMCNDDLIAFAHEVVFQQKTKISFIVYYQNFFTSWHNMLLNNFPAKIENDGDFLGILKKQVQKWVSSLQPLYDNKNSADSTLYPGLLVVFIQ